MRFLYRPKEPKPILKARYHPAFDALEQRLLLSVTIAVNAGSNLHPINPNVYGVALADSTALADLNVAINRYGGNNTSSYNWQVNADNRGSDWYFESIGDSSSVPGQRGDSLIADAKAAGAQADLTIPTIDWVANLGPNRDKLASFSIAKYGPQTGSDNWFPDAGTGVATNGQDIKGNNPNDANVPNSPAFEKGWVQHLVNQWGTATQGGLRYYTLDNEPSIWFQTHRDVAPVGATMQQIRDKIISYASMIKSVDPSALVVGPEEWGWSGYFYSGYDQQYGSVHGWGGTLPDRAAHGNMNYLPWLLDQLRQNQASTGQRLLDVFSIHYYPQGGEFSDDVSTTMQLLRNQSTRSLWDPNYVDQSWINDKVQLIPRLKSWVNSYYPGTQIGITEYNWGAENHMNGATTQADILGIFGREGLDLATRWTTPAAGTPVYNAIKMYRNYDGNKSTFGDTSVAAAVPNPDQVSAFSALRSSDGALTIMVDNKNLYDPNNPSATTSITINLSNFQSDGTAQEWELAAVNPSDMTHSVITHLSDVHFAGNSFTVTVPMQSVTLFVLKPAFATKVTATTQVIMATAGAAFHGMVASFTDTDSTATSFTASITWGDGQTSPGQVSPHAGGGFDVTGTNSYAQEGRYAFSVSITDSHGNTGLATGTAHVARVGPPPGGLSTVANALTHSAENYANFIMAAYQSYLSRTAATSEVNGWVRAMQNGFSDEQLEAGFIGSAEYIQNHGGSGSAWVKGMYQDLLGRTPAQAEVNSWVQAMANGMSPNQVAYGFAASAERETQRVTGDYQKYVDRAPDASEVAGWVNAFVHGMRNEDVIAGFVASVEYFQSHYSNIDDWLWSAYQDILGRAPDGAGFQAWRGILQNS